MFHKPYFTYANNVYSYYMYVIFFQQQGELEWALDIALYYCSSISFIHVHVYCRQLSKYPAPTNWSGQLNLSTYYILQPANNTK